MTFEKGRPWWLVKYQKWEDMLLNFRDGKMKPIIVQRHLRRQLFWSNLHPKTIYQAS